MTSSSSGARERNHAFARLFAPTSAADPRADRPALPHRLTAGVVTLFYRYGHYFDDDPDNRFHEAGLLLKWGLPFYKKL